jgi:hypothetical protein
LENIIHLNEGLSSEFAFGPDEEKKSGRYDFMAVERMSGSLESEPGHLL